MNKTLLIGRLVADPKLAKTANEKTYLRVTLAVNRRFKNEAGQRQADFISLILWGKLAENFASYLKKGALVSIEGEIRGRHYTDKDDHTHYVTEVLVNDYQMLESRAAIAMRTNRTDAEDLELAGEELPF